MGSSSSSTTTTVRKRDPDSEEITALQNALYSSFTPMASQLGSDYSAASNRASEYQSNYDSAYSALQALMESGNLPSGLTDAMEGYITRAMNKSLGTAMATNAGKGILNSSVTNRAISEIATNTADALASNYLDAYNAASGNYSTLLDSSLAAQSQLYSDLATKYAPLLEFYSTVRSSEDQEDYDTVVEQGGK